MDIAPVVGVLGNHEENLKLDYPHLLDNESLFLQIKDNSIEVYGVSPIHPVNPDESNHTLRLVLDHYPKPFENYSDTYVFSGHAHGGQFRFNKQGLFAPDQGFLPKYTKGFYKMNDNSGLFVSAGLGPSAIPLRFNNPNHLIVVDFISNHV